MSLSKLQIAILIITMIVTICKGHINMTSYTQMPPLYVFDDFKECFINKTLDFSNSYCMIYAEIQPDNTSLLWQQIHQFSNSNKFHYRHDHLFRGVCLANIKDLNMTTMDYNLDIPDNEITLFFKRIYKHSMDNSIDLNYQQKIRYYLYETFHGEYNLTLQTLILYCENSKQSQESQVSRYLTTFSLYRNFKRLVVPSKNRDLRFLDGLRTILSFLIVCEHLFYLQFVHLKNPEFFENLYHQFMVIFMYHGMVFVELFFVLSGLMLYLKFENGQYIKTKSSTKDVIKVYGRLMFSRYMRFLPTLLFLILVSINFVKYFENGAFGRYMIQPSVMTCSEYWWKNILMINNFSINNSCWSHTWYIAADFQLYAFYLIILITVAKYPKCKIFMVTIMLFLAAAIPVSINYLRKLDSISTMSLEGFRYFYAKDIETGLQLYLPSYTNLNGYLMGIICGETYIKYLKNNTQNREFLGKILKYSPYIGWLCIMGIFYLGTLILFKKPTFWTALYGLLQRHVTIDIITTTTIIFLICRGRILQKFLSLLPFRLMARISYQVYLWHFVLIFLIINYFGETINITYLLMLAVLLTAYITANIVGFFVTLMVEYPIAEIFNIFNLR